MRIISQLVVVGQSAFSVGFQLEHISSQNVEFLQIVGGHTGEREILESTVEKMSQEYGNRKRNWRHT